MRRFFVGAVLSLTILLVAGAGYSAVDNTLSAQDRETIAALLSDYAIAAPPSTRSYEDEVTFIAAAQRAVLDRVDGRKGLPLGVLREPAQVLEAKTGECYDRSRLLEKLFRMAGMETRHLAVYATDETGSALRSLITSQVPSHALSEVLTRRGWLVVDSNDAWLSLDADGNPVDLAAVQADVERGTIVWDGRYASRMNGIFTRSFTFVYGLYSRHGRFYPPFNPIPDIHYGELVANLP